MLQALLGEGAEGAEGAEDEEEDEEEINLHAAASDGKRLLDVCLVVTLVWSWTPACTPRPLQGSMHAALGALCGSQR